MRAKENVSLTCGNCVYWQQHNPSPQASGECRVKPPVILEIESPSRERLAYKGHWPTTKRHEWCGYHLAETPDVDEMY